MKKPDTYLSLCTEVYDLSRPNTPKDAYEFYRNYVLNAKGPSLEPMCGTGRFLLPLLEEGFDVRGFDASAHMLKVLQAKAKAKNIKPQVWKGFVEEFKRPEKYNLIFIPIGSFSLITDPASVKSALKTFRDHLSNDGVLLFEANTPACNPPSLGVWQGKYWRRTDGKVILLSSLASIKDSILTSLGKYELIHNNSIIRTEIEEFKFRLYDPPEVIELLKASGFKDVRTIKAFDSTAIPDKTDESVVYECR
jgi:SAM-dependent methyltransferase